MTHKVLFDENEAPENTIAKQKWLTARLSIITQEYCLQQIAKLHDPAKHGNATNLSIDYVVQWGDWGQRSDEVKRLHSRLLKLWNRLEPARNKTLAHNDLEALMTNKPLGAFPKGADEDYFEALQELVNEVHKKWIGGPRPFNDLAKMDAQEFLALLERA